MSSNKWGGDSRDGVFVAMRTFNPESLVTSDGKSVISRLAENSDYVVIEDADLRPPDLIQHLTAFSVRSVNVYDMTKTLRLKDNNSYVIRPKRRSESPPF